MLTHRQEKYYWHRCQKRLCLNVKRMKHYYYIAVSKFVDHLPEHRIQQMLKARTGGNTTVYDEYVDTENG